MSVIVDRSSRVIVQGFTGQHATFHAEEAMAHGTTIVGGVTPGKGGTRHLDRPVFDSVAEAVAVGVGRLDVDRERAEPLAVEVVAADQVRQVGRHQEVGGRVGALALEPLEQLGRAAAA